MTGDQRLILKIEHAVEEIERDRLLAAYHVLDEILKELAPQGVPMSHETLHLAALEHARPSSRPPVAAAG